MKRSPRIRRRLAVVLVALAAAMPGAAVWAQPPDHLVKAVSIYKVAQFTSWATPPADGMPLSLCLFGSDEVSRSLVRFDGETVAGRRLAVTTPKDANASCAIAYLAESERPAWPRLLAALHAHGTLTVLDTGTALDDVGAVLTVATVDRRVVFGINADRARAANLSISAKVMRLAAKVFAL